MIVYMLRFRGSYGMENLGVHSSHSRAEEAAQQEMQERGRGWGNWVNNGGGFWTCENSDHGDVMAIEAWGVDGVPNDEKETSGG